MSNNAGKLFHYRITVSPPTNFLVRKLLWKRSRVPPDAAVTLTGFLSVFQTDRPTVIEYDDHEYLFEGFSLFSHKPLTSVWKLLPFVVKVANPKCGLCFSVISNRSDRFGQESRCEM